MEKRKLPYNLDIPGQISEYELRAIEAVASLLPKGGHAVEVGSLFGCSSWAWAKSCDPSVTVHCIDPWEGNEGVRAMEARYGVKYGIEAFRDFTVDCPNIQPHQGFSPRDFKDWSTPIDLYFEDAVHVDPVLTQNIEFWSAKLKPSGIMCGHDYRPRFPDVRAIAEGMAKRLGRRLQCVEFFWCLLPDEKQLPGAEKVYRFLEELSLECTQAKIAKGISISVKPIHKVLELAGKGPHTIELSVTNEGATAWPTEDGAEPLLVALAESMNLRSKPSIVATQKLGRLLPDIPIRASLSLDMVGVQPGMLNLSFNLRVEISGNSQDLKCGSLSNLQFKSGLDPATMGDWVSRSAPDRPADWLRLDDVVHAYRWILGREPENAAKLQAHIDRAQGNPERLRMNLLTSTEFGRRIEAAGLGDGSTKADVIDLPAYTPTIDAERPLVFIHLPKTGGTSVHYHLQNGFDEAQICSLRHNDILVAPVYKLTGRKLFSGHFDARVLHLVGASSLVTVFRDPGERLYSLYRHLRFTTPDRQVAANHDLAELARSYDFEAFLSEAARRNPGTVDNSYVRALGGTLPIERWERSAESEWAARYGELSNVEWDEMIARATAVLTMPSTTILDFSCLSKDLNTFLMKAGLDYEGPIQHLKNSDSITDETVGFKPVEIEPYGQNDTLDQLTRYDRQLMNAIRALV